ncbi:unnamed protein product, partial [Tetraodon nigroviridis]
ETQLMLSVALIEKDVNGDTLWVWCYPSVGSDFRQVLLSKCCLTQDSQDFRVFVFGQFSRTWYYITTIEVPEHTALTKVRDAKFSTAVEQQSIVLLFALTFFLIFFFFFMSRLLISQYLLQQKISTLRSMLLLTEYLAGLCPHHL